MSCLDVCGIFCLYVCVFACVQESCHCFWPQDFGVEGVKEVHGKLAVSVRRVNSHGDITERRLEVQERVEKESHRVVTLLQMRGWPPQELPHPSAMLSLVDFLSKAQRRSPSKHTIIMCRSACHVLLLDIQWNISILSSYHMETI